MLIHSTWTLSVSEPTVLPRSYNLELVKLLHHKIGLELGSEVIPSISFSGICGLHTISYDFLTFQPQEFYQLSLCGLKESSSKALSLLDINESLEFLGAKFNIINRDDKITSYEKIYTNLVANEPEPIRQFKFKFITPTAFAQGGVTLPVPIPTLMFRSWLERWNNFAPVYLGDDELIAYLSNAIFVKHHNIKTRIWQLQRGYVNGFVGDVTLQIFNRADSLLANVANLLAYYSQFAGTGIKTRLGMGQTEFKSSTN